MAKAPVTPDKWQVVAAVSPDHGTPTAVIEGARSVLGGFDLDPASSDYWNHYTVKARTFFDERIDGLAQAWRGRVIVNPPGTVTKPGQARPISLPKRFWQKLVDHYVAGEVSSAIWVGFSIEQIQVLQGCTMHPLQFVTLFPCERLCFLQRGPGNSAPVEGASPMHGNYITLLPDRSDRQRAAQQVRAFVELSQRLDGGCSGALVRPAI